MITEIEQAVCERLRRGLGQMVRTVKSYGGELDDLPNAVRTLPAVWTAYGGAKIAAADTRKSRYRHEAEIVVMLAARSLRSEAAGRQGGIDRREVGSNTLVEAVLRLLASQTLGGLVQNGLTPKAVRPVYNGALVGNAAVSVFAVEFAAVWDEWPLEDGRYPEISDGIDKLLLDYRGERSEAWPDFTAFDALIFEPAQQTANVANHLILGGQDDD